jgi:hypothetical protein
MTMSLDAAAPSGDAGIAWDAVMAAKLRPNATAAAAISFMEMSFLVGLPRQRRVNLALGLWRGGNAKSRRQVSRRRGERPLNCLSGAGPYKNFMVVKKGRKRGRIIAFGRDHVGRSRFGDCYPAAARLSFANGPA